MHFHGWQLGLKTGMYYLRTKAATEAIKFTVDVDKIKRANTSPALVSSAGGYPTGAASSATAATSTETTSANSVEKQAIDALKAGAPKYDCVGCSA
mmetsp:Transcript_103495/g.293000  ORF Transcript_103495/g.293000 Transcript_103495/m.293000 type:complete len:96 (-) Transcript_103495:73-360(-)